MEHWKEAKNEMEAAFKNDQHTTRKSAAFERSDFRDISRDRKIAVARYVILFDKLRKAKPILGDQKIKQSEFYKSSQYVLTSFRAALNHQPFGFASSWI